MTAPIRLRLGGRGSRFDPPVPTRSMLLRPRLLSLLRERWDRRATVVVAGPGFGKTTLLAQAVTENALDPRGIDLWVACDPEDAAASVLGGALYHVLGIQEPATDDPRAVADVVAAAVAALAPAAVSLVFDDVHAIVAESGGAALIGELAARLPATGHLVLGARRAPPIPLARLVAQGDAARLSEDDLAFTDSEIAEFSELRSVSVDLLRDLGRWPAIAELAASAGTPVVREYLWDEALGSMPAPRRRALAILSVAGDVDEETLAVAVGETVPVADLLADLPLASLAPDGSAFVHALWHEPLRGELDDDERREVQVKVGRHLRARGDHLRAFRLFTDAASWDDALEVVVDVCGSLPSLAPDVLTRWLESLPADVRTRPEGQLLTAVIAKQRNASPVDQLWAAAAACRDQGLVRAEVACLPHLGHLGFWNGDAGLVGATVLRALELEGEGSRDAAELAGLGRAVLPFAIGTPEEVLEAVEALPPPTRTGEWRQIVALLSAESLVSLGRAHEAIPIAEASADFHILATDTLPCALWHVGRLDDARDASEAGVERVAKLGITRDLQAATSQTARFMAFLGEPELAAAYLARCENTGPPAAVQVEARVYLARAAIEIAVGAEERATALLAEMVDQHPVQTDAFWLAQRRALAISYVLVEESRSFWEEQSLSGVFETTRSAARALVALRAGDPSALRELASLAPEDVRPALPLSWVVELAVGAAAAGRDDGRELIGALGPSARPCLATLASLDDRSVKQAAQQLLRTIPDVPDALTEVRLLGPAMLLRDGEIIDSPEWRRERVRQLFALLVVHETATREAVVDALWPDLDLDAGANNLRANLSYLLRALQPTRADKEASYFIAQRAKTLTLTGRDRLRVDVWEFEQHLDEALVAEEAGAPSVALASYRRAVESWRGPLLDGASGGWMEREAERLRMRFVSAATRAAELALAAGEHAESETLAARALDVEAWAEGAYRVMATAQLERGDRTAANRTFARCRSMIAELGVDPEPATLMLERRLVEAPGRR